MRTLIVLLAVAIAHASCASVEGDDSIHVQDIDHRSLDSDNTSHDYPPSHYVRSFTVVASYDAIRGYGPDPKQAVEAITQEIIASHGFCPNGYSIGRSPHAGTYRTVNWQIICSE
jgi:hypothetical protein